MKNTAKKSLSVVLAMLMLLSTLTTGAIASFADDDKINFVNYTAPVTVEKEETNYYRFTPTVTSYYSIDVATSAINKDNYADSSVTIYKQEKDYPDELGDYEDDRESWSTTLYSVVDSMLKKETAYVPAHCDIKLKAGETYQFRVRTYSNTKTVFSINATDYRISYDTYSDTLSYTKYKTTEYKYNPETDEYDEVEVIREYDYPQESKYTTAIGARIYGYDGADTALNIPAVTNAGYAVKELGLYNVSSALKKRITSIAIPEGVVSIGSLYDMYKLSSVNLPSTLKAINDSCFCNDHALSGKIVIPANVEYVGSYAFYDTGLTSAQVLSVKTEIGDYAFGYKEVLNTATANPNDTMEELVQGFMILAPAASFATQYAVNNGIASYDPANCTAGNHPYNVTTVAATIFAKGSTKSVCPICGAVETKAIAKKKLKISSLKAAKKAVTVKVAKHSEAKGYQIQVSTSKKFTKKTTKTVKVKTSKALNKKITGLKSGKKYYVRVRAYKTSGKKTVYSSYSAVKSVKVK